MIRVDLNSCNSFIPLPYEAALAPRLRIAHDHLQKGDGAGSDFTASRPRQRASRRTLRRWWSSASAAPIWAPGA